VWDDIFQEIVKLREDRLDVWGKELSFCSKWI
jgi:hypothetical protein